MTLLSNFKLECKNIYIYMTDNDDLNIKEM